VAQAAPSPASPPAESGDTSLSGPDTAAWHPGDDDHDVNGMDETRITPPRPTIAAPEAGAEVAAAAHADDQAMDEFFDDQDYAEDRRFGGRLRRRR
jgi:hypothetical protein